MGRRVFLSYAHADSARVQRIAKALPRHGITPWTGETIQMGADIYQEITRAIERADALIVFMSARSRNNPNLFLEMGIAWAAKKPTLVVLMGGKAKTLPFNLGALAYVNLGDSTPASAARKLATRMLRALQHADESPGTVRPLRALHVEAAPNGAWRVTSSEKASWSTRHSSKAAATRTARAAAKTTRDAEVVIHRKDGTIQSRTTYHARPDSANATTRR